MELQQESSDAATLFSTASRNLSSSSSTSVSANQSLFSTPLCLSARILDHAHPDNSLNGIILSRATLVQGEELPSATVGLLPSDASPPPFDGTHYAAWKHKMKFYLMALHPSLWRMVCTGLNVPEEDMELTPEQEQAVHCNAQAANAILAALSPKEFNKVDGLEVAKDIWDTLQVAHEGTRRVGEARIELLEGQLARFVMEDDESPQEMYDRLIILVNKIRGLGSKEMTNHFVVRRLLQAFWPSNPALVMIIRERPDFKELTPSEVLGRITLHELLEEEAKLIKNLSQNAAISKNKDVALKAKNMDEASGELDEGEEFALMVKQLKQFLRRKGAFGRNKKVEEGSRKRQSKKACHKCGKYGHSILDCPNKGKSKEGKSKFHEKKLSGQAHVGEEWDSNDESDSDGEEGVASIAIKTSTPSSSLFDN